MQDDWCKWLALAEFATNNQASETTGISPFFANYGYDPRWAHEPIPAAAAEIELVAAEPAAQELASKIHEITEHLRSEITRAHEPQQAGTDASRTPAPIIKVDDQV